MSDSSTVLENTLTLLKATGHTCVDKRVIDVTYTGNDGNQRALASIFPDDKYVQFHDEFTQIGIGIPGFDELCKEYDHNHT